MNEKRRNVIKEALSKGIIRYDPRKTDGPKAYDSMKNVEVWIKHDLREGNFIEAYSICDQYVDTVVKICFPEIFHSKDDDRLNVETVLRLSVPLKIIGEHFLLLYRDFKSTRDDLIHKSVFNQKTAKQLQNNKKIEALPLQVIKEARSLFKSRFEHVLKFYTDSFDDTQIREKGRRWKLYSYIELDETFRTFVLIWYRILANESKDIFSEMLSNPKKFSKFI